jgi:hypothetical protein
MAVGLATKAEGRAMAVCIVLMGIQKIDLKRLNGIVSLNQVLKFLVVGKRELFEFKRHHILLQTQHF